MSKQKPGMNLKALQNGILFSLMLWLVFFTCVHYALAQNQGHQPVPYITYPTGNGTISYPLLYVLPDLDRLPKYEKTEQKPEVIYRNQEGTIWRSDWDLDFNFDSDYDEE